MMAAMPTDDTCFSYGFGQFLSCLIIYGNVFQASAICEVLAFVEAGFITGRIPQTTTSNVKRLGKKFNQDQISTRD